MILNIYLKKTQSNNKKNPISRGASYAFNIHKLSWRENNLKIC